MRRDKRDIFKRTGWLLAGVCCWLWPALSIAAEPASVLVDKATIQSPVIGQLLGQMYVKEQGTEEEILALSMQQQTGGGIPLEEKGGIESQGGQPRVGNIKTPKGREEADLSLSESGSRRSPTEGV